ncbi:DUF433 domain-containing protein [bacterium]|nr:MAG: DUF433 domain-containing protein [bacterium]
MTATREHCHLIWQDEDRVSGAVCFYGTRVPVQHMLDYVKAGQKVEEFCEDYRIPVSQAKDVLELSVKGFETLLANAA